MSAKSQESLDFAKRAGELALEKKANNVRILDVHELTSLTDAFVVCSGESDIQVKAITDHILDELAELDKPWNREGYDNREWVLLDYVHVVVHIFHESARSYYDIERLWPDAAITELRDETPPAADTPMFEDL
jgi:ribosome-associated protein